MGLPETKQIKRASEVSRIDIQIMKPNERNYTYSQSQQLSMQTGLIGHLRADMDSNGEGFFSSWDDFRKDLKTQEFKDEFDEVINELRKDGGILHNRSEERRVGIECR